MGSSSRSSARRFSLLEAGGLSGSRRLSTASTTAGNPRRQSIAAEAFSVQADVGGEHASTSSSDKVQVAQNVPVVRKWWAERRQFLLDDLYPMGSSPGGPARSPVAKGVRKAGQMEALPETRAERRNLGKEFD